MRREVYGRREKRAREAKEIWNPEYKGAGSIDPLPPFRPPPPPFPTTIQTAPLPTRPKAWNKTVGKHKINTREPQCGWSKLI